MSTSNATPSADPNDGPRLTLRAHLLHLVPRHALFYVTIQIHQLASVPLVRGEFSVKWKWKNTRKVKDKDKERALETPDVDGDDDGDGDEDSFGSVEDPQPSPMSASAEDRQDASTISTRGQTPFLPLRDHSVIWDYPLSAVVRMSIDRDTHRLLPHPFTLKVVQLVVPGDPDAPPNPRLGTVELDLAEYADSFPAAAGNRDGPPKGTVMRRYLLLDSKTNATLRLSIRVEPVLSPPPPPFVAPPLPQSEILAGVEAATLLSTRAEVYRTRPHALDLYAPLAVAHDDTLSLPDASTRKFDMRALPLASGPVSTTSLIDALFNPAPVHDARLLSPFTRLVPAPESASPSLAPSSRASSESGGTPPRSKAPSFITLDSSAPSVDRHAPELLDPRPHR
ncbi:C2 NT-type domain-containing protein [Mycena sanguinolenta]|uniref:C2 NT-type domain-containing protein n=1 Tax=Mycena sanguinolenta TaxID=230812 RepID=A0A8H7DCT5_9AGAR|nr:C2 NT-type domain-containing protein [Mycena sanguinolenta]